MRVTTQSLSWLDINRDLDAWRKEVMSINTTHFYVIFMNSILTMNKDNIDSFIDLITSGKRTFEYTVVNGVLCIK